MFEVLTGIELYHIPEMFGHCIITVNLESLEDIIVGDVALSQRQDDKITFNTKGYAEAIANGFLPAIESLFVHHDYVTDISLEYENLVSQRKYYVTENYIDRALSEFEEMLAYSETIKIDNDEFEHVKKDLWKQKLKVKFYCMYQLDSLLKIMKDITLPGDPFKFEQISDIDIIDKNIQNLKTEVLDMKSSFYNEIDYLFLIKTLRVEHLNRLKNE